MNKELQPKIDELFRWRGKIEITGSEGEIVETLYQRVIGDADIQKARLEALKASKLLRKALKDIDSDEYLVNIPFEDDYTQEELTTLIIFSKYSSFRQNAELRVNETRVKEPKSDATLEEQEEYITKIEEAKQTYEESVNEEIKRQGEKLEEELKGNTVLELFNMYKKEHIDIACRIRMIEVFDEFATLFGTYSDEKLKNRRFENIEDFRDLSPRVKSRLMDNYKKIELNLTEVKK